MSRRILVTGASGFVGKHLIKELMMNPDMVIYALLRKRGAETATERCKKLFADLSPTEWARIIPVEGEITQKQFGLTDADFTSLSSNINEIFHTAASVKFNLPYEEAKTINVTGTENVLGLAKAVGFSALKRYNHISTAYVDRGKVSGLERLFNNSYEQTKHEAEQLVKTQPDLSYTIYRPSIISGNSVTGEIADTSVIFKFMLLLSKHLLHELPSNRNSSLNVIPVNNFIEQMLELSVKENAVGKSFFITNHENVKFEDLISYSCELMGVKSPSFLPLKDAQRIPLRALNQIQTFLPYISQSQKFDLKTTKEVLGKSYHLCDNAIKAQERIVASCLSSKRLVPRV